MTPSPRPRYRIMIAVWPGRWLSQIHFLVDIGNAAAQAVVSRRVRHIALRAVAVVRDDPQLTALAFLIHALIRKNFYAFDSRFVVDRPGCAGIDPCDERVVFGRTDPAFACRPHGHGRYGFLEKSGFRRRRQAKSGAACVREAIAEWSCSGANPNNESLNPPWPNCPP